MSTFDVGRACDLGVDRHEIQDFYRVHWARRIALSHDSFYAWQFVDNPAQRGHDECVVATRGGEIAGVMGANSRPFFLNGRQRRGAELTTWVVADKFKGAGVGTGILGHLMSSYEVLVGTGITGAALPVYLRSGFHYIRGLPRFVRVLDLEGVEAYAKVEPLGRKLARSRAATAPPGDVDAQPLSDGDADAIFTAFAANHHLFDRRPAWLDWRYARHPRFDYELTCLGSPAGGRAVLASRIDVLPNGARILRVMDLFGPAMMLAPALGYIDRRCREEGLALADFFCTASAHNAALMAAGWFSTLDEPFFQFPHLFSPIELREPATTSLILWSRAELASLLDASALYLTKQDADLDRPTLEAFAP